MTSADLETRYRSYLDTLTNDASMILCIMCKTNCRITVRR